MKDTYLFLKNIHEYRSEQKSLILHNTQLLMKADSILSDSAHPLHLVSDLAFGFLLKYPLAKTNRHKHRAIPLLSSSSKR